MIQNKCKGCTERHVGCHSTCEDYKKFQEENEKAKKALREANRNIPLNSDGTMFAGKSIRRKSGR